MKRTLISVLTAGLIATSSVVAVAAPFDHGPARIMMAIADFKADLNLSATQEQQWQVAAQATMAALRDAKATRETTKAAVRAELAKPRPDFAAIGATRDQNATNAITRIQQVRAEWLKLYDSMTAEQVTTVKERVQRLLDKLDALSMLGSASSSGAF